MYQAIDIKKYKTDEQITNVTAHNLRTNLSNNVNPKKTKLNKFFIGSADMDFDKLLADKLSSCGKFRKDAVKVVNLVFSASPEFFKNGGKVKEWETLTQRFAEETFGKENILYSVVHYDEKTPHFHISVVPIKDGKLNASHWLDGRAKLKAFHDNYHKAVKNLGLKRGEERKKPTYVSLEDYYKKVNASAEYEQKLDEKLDRVLTHLDNPSFSEKVNPWGFISKTLKPYIENMGKSLAYYREKAKKYDGVKKELDKAEDKIADYEAKFEEMGLKPTLTYEACRWHKSKLFPSSVPAVQEKKAPLSKREGEDLEYIQSQEVKKKIKPR